MSTASFVVTLTNLQPQDDLSAVAEDIFDNLSDNYVVVSVNPWARDEATPALAPDLTSGPSGMVQPSNPLAQS